MSAAAISLIVFGCVFGGALVGIALRKVLPDHHRNEDSKDLVRSGMGLIGTMSALVLGLLVASAKSSYDTQRDEVTQLAAGIGLLDRVLAQYGPETKDVRDLLRAVVAWTIDRMWPESRSRPEGLEPEGPPGGLLFERVQNLSPKNESQRALQAQASAILIQLVQIRSLMTAQKGSSISMPLLVIVVFWLTINFLSFGLFAPPNATVAATLFVCAVSVALAVLLILELDQPYQGLIQISDAPLRDALAHLGR
jgi:hypothetical protein